VTLLALLVQSVGAHARAAWQCEGQNCGTTPWVCCCESPAEGFADACDAPVSEASAEAGPVAHEGPCSAGCGCDFKLETGESDIRTASQVSLISTFLPVLVERAQPEVTPLPATLLARHSHGRDPPSRAFASAPPSLRGPPAA
jgi:hypothetical protein